MRWLRFGRMIDPMTSEPVCEDFAYNLLEPVRLAHSTDEGLRETKAFLKRSGFLDGRGGGDEVFLCLC